MKRLDEIHLLGTSFTMCVEEWPNGGLRSMFTVLILCSQYILPVIVLPSFYYNVRIILSANCYSFWFITSHCVQILTYLQEQQEDSFGEERKLKKLTLILAFLAIIFAVVQKVSTFRKLYKTYCRCPIYLSIFSSRWLNLDSYSYQMLMSEFKKSEVA